MNDRHLDDEQSTDGRTCPVCEGVDLVELSVRRSPALLRCRSCHLTFRSEPVPDIVDQRMARDALEQLGARRQTLYTAMLGSLQAQRQMGTLLDVGCGNGHFARWVRQYGWRVAALDSSDHLCRQARGFGTRNVVRGFAQNLPFPSRRFDVVTLWDVIDHLEEPIPALMEARRVLRPGGMLHMRVRNGPVHLALRRNVLVPIAASVMHNLLFSGDSLATALGVAGFVDVESDVAPLTTGDPYASPTRRASTALRAFKSLWSAGAKLASGLTHRHFLLAPSIQAFARRPAD